MELPNLGLTIKIVTIENLYVKENGKYYKNIAKLLKLYNKMTKAIVIITKKLYNIYGRLTCEGIRLGS